VWVIFTEHFPNQIRIETTEASAEDTDYLEVRPKLTSFVVVLSLEFELSYASKTRQKSSFEGQCLLLYNLRSNEVINDEVNG
jgi:hypothetical protein